MKKNTTYQQRIWQRFRKNRAAKWSLYVLYGLLFVAVFADFLANEKPIWCKIEGENYFPIFRSYLVDIGVAEWPDGLANYQWKTDNYDSVLRTPIPYSPMNLDMSNTNVGPFEEQSVDTPHFHHRLGTTERLGYDVAAGLIHGTRMAMLVGFLAMTLATFLGLLFGTLAGYFGDTNFRTTRARWWAFLLALFPAFFYGFLVRSYTISNSKAQFWELGKSLVLIALIFLIFNQLARFLEKNKFFQKRVTIPMDTLVMRFIEVINSIPGLLLILSIIAILNQRSVLLIMIIIGLVAWTGIARFVRAELLRIRQLGYIESAKALGFSEWRIIFRHALPNALTPVLISIAFGIAGAILLEAALSFLGIGASENEMTWGKLLGMARTNFDAWWLAIFPGLAIFITVTIFNLIGEGLTEAMERN